MTVLEQLEKDAEIGEVDILNICGFIMHAIEVNAIGKKHETISIKETILDSLAGILEKMLTKNLNFSTQAKVEIIHLLNKLKANKEYMQLVKNDLINDNEALADMMAASARLARKSQSAFEMD